MDHNYIAVNFLSCWQSTLAVLCLCVISYFIWVWSTLPGEPDITGRHVLITGGSSGCGLCIAKNVLLRGANVTIIARNQNRLKQAKKDLSLYAKGDATITTISMDLGSSYADIKSVVDSQIDTVDILIHCAGFAVSRTFIDTPDNAFVDLINANYLGPVHLTKALLPKMLLTSSDGLTCPNTRRIAFFSSMAGQISIFGFSAYTGSKFAIRGFAEVLRQELEPLGLPVTTVFPPDTDTPGLAAENVGKPHITSMISGTGSLFQAEHVASRAIHSILSGHRTCLFGIQGVILSIATSGVNLPHDSCLGPVLVSLVEIFSAPFIRMITIMFAIWMQFIIYRQ